MGFPFLCTCFAVDENLLVVSTVHKKKNSRRGVRNVLKMREFKIRHPEPNDSGQGTAPSILYSQTVILLTCWINKVQDI